ncbi:MAG: redoxin domain-containing protein [Planctomycetes bacterium]|nr:redoxin domain-containing protein [Planctomycetota bacterium]
MSWFLAALLTALLPQQAPVPAPGAPVPEFRMADQDGRWITSASLLGKRYLLAFYPKDFTGG